MASDAVAAAPQRRFCCECVSRSAAIRPTATTLHASNERVSGVELVEMDRADTTEVPAASEKGGFSSIERDGVATTAARLAPLRPRARVTRDETRESGTVILGRTHRGVRIPTGGSPALETAAFYSLASPRRVTDSREIAARSSQPAPAAARLIGGARLLRTMHTTRVMDANATGRSFRTPVPQTEPPVAPAPLQKPPALSQSASDLVFGYLLRQFCSDDRAIAREHAQ